MVSLRTVGLYASLLVFTGGAAIAVQAVPDQPARSLTAPMAQTSTNSPSRLLQRRVQRDLASRLNVPISSVRVVEATPKVWPDQCLGLARPNERCRGGEVNGWQIQVASAQQMWTYRSDRTGQRLKLEPLVAAPDFGTGVFSADTSRRLLQTVAEQINQPVSRLQILEVQSATWDGCLGVYTPEQACTAIALAGFRTLITDGQTLWVYHLSEDGEQIAQNDTASGAQQPLLVSFIPHDTLTLADQVVFQSQLSGDLAGSVQKLILMADGRLYREQSQALSGNEPTRELIKTLSVEAVDDFRNQLDQHRFHNFNRLRYLSEAAFADYPTTRLQTPYASVDYIDLEVENLPPDLREMITLWETLTQVD
ncbi:MAG: hypothetical protein F6J97_05045 [Leptolyngbya sp. SIO4C1]|nr:hypothetical protein [Leptolyngbya sp. SIO4C1]